MRVLSPASLAAATARSSPTVGYHDPDATRKLGS
jgi:hypothetical protein